MPAVGVVNPVPFIERDGLFWMNPDETHALRCWTDHFAETILLKPRLAVDRVPDGWAPMPADVTVEPLFDMTFARTPSMWTRWRGTRRAVARVKDRLGLAYLRAPDWEACWAEDELAGSGVPLLVELFGDWETTFLAEWGGGGLAKRWLRHPMARWADRRTQKQADAAAVLGCMGEALREKYASGRKAYVTTAHLVPESRFHRRADTCTGGTVRLLFVGILAPRKGVTHLVDAVASLRAAGRKVEVDLVGDGPQQAELEAKIATAGLADAFAFHGRIPHGERLLDFFRNADVFVLPSVGAEGLPRVIQEALSASCPVVATDVGSVHFQLGDGAHGAVVPPGDSKALADAIARVIDDPEYRRALLASGYEEALAHSFERQWHDVRDLLRDNVHAALLRDAGAPDPPA